MKKDNLICELCYLKEPDMFMISDNQTAYPKICMDCKEIILQQEGSVDDFKFIEIKWKKILKDQQNFDSFSRRLDIISKFELLIKNRLTEENTPIHFSLES